MRYLAIAVLFLVPLAASADTIVTVDANVQYANSYGSFVASYDFDVTTATLVPNTLSYNFTGTFAPYTFNGQASLAGINFTSASFPGVFLQLFFRDHGESFPNLGSYCTCDVELDNFPVEHYRASVLAGSFVSVTDPPDAPATPEPNELSLAAIGIAGLVVSRRWLPVCLRS